MTFRAWNKETGDSIGCQHIDDLDRDRERLNEWIASLGNPAQIEIGIAK